MNCIVPDWPDLPVNIGALSTTRRGGFSVSPYDDGDGGGGMNLGAFVNDRVDDVERNRSLLRTMLPNDPAWLLQIHGNTVLDASTVIHCPKADASIATEAGVVCAICTADCLPVLFSDRAGRVVGAAHAGWRGLAGGILDVTVARMREAGAGDIVAWLGPAIGPDRFEVGEDVRSAFTQRHADAASAFAPIKASAGKYFADIYRLARMELAQIGIGSVAGGGFCTVQDSQRFYSYRRDHVTGRMASLIWIKEAG